MQNPLRKPTEATSNSALPDGFTVSWPDNFAQAETTLADANDPYFYAARRMQAGEATTLPLWPRVIVFLPYNSDITLQVGADITLSAGDSYCITGAGALPMACTAGSGLVLLAGSAANPNKPQPEFTRAGAHYKVTKPWGHELWLNGEDEIFCFKEVHIKAGNQTSLQYHNFKTETNFLYDGACDLIYSSVDDLTANHLAEMPMTSPTALHITPRTLHRLRAKTDLYLYETSTPHLDDVIRVQDDANRTDGRVASEHGK